jgi:hypothetical protein
MGHVSSRAQVPGLAAGVVGLALVWRLAGPVSAPLYDGCITETYRLLGHNPAPTSASHTFPPGNDFQPAEVISNEAPAQAQILMMAGTFVSGTSFTVSITPIRQPQPPPGGESFDGNVYRIVAITSGGQMLEPRPQDPVTIVLRATSSGGAPRTIIRLDGSAWTKLKTFSAGCGDEYEAVSGRLGVFATVKSGGQQGGQGSPAGFPVAALVAIIAVVLILAVFFLLRLNRGVRP